MVQLSLKCNRNFARLLVGYQSVVGSRCPFSTTVSLWGDDPITDDKRVFDFADRNSIGLSEMWQSPLQPPGAGVRPVSGIGLVKARVVRLLCHRSYVDYNSMRIVFRLTSHVSLKPLSNGLYESI
jgi:hypothetical protein